MPYSSFQPFHKLERHKQCIKITTSDRNYMGEKKWNFITMCGILGFKTGKWLNYGSQLECRYELISIMFSCFVLTLW
jgi:hypothetical protein